MANSWVDTLVAFVTADEEQFGPAGYWTDMGRHDGIEVWKEYSTAERINTKKIMQERQGRNGEHASVLDVGCCNAATLVGTRHECDNSDKDKTNDTQKQNCESYFIGDTEDTIYDVPWTFATVAASRVLQLEILAPFGGGADDVEFACNFEDAKVSGFETESTSLFPGEVASNPKSFGAKRRRWCDIMDDAEDVFKPASQTMFQPAWNELPRPPEGSVDATEDDKKTTLEAEELPRPPENACRTDRRRRGRPPRSPAQPKTIAEPD
jgi:hypothetical protein